MSTREWNTACAATDCRTIHAGALAELGLAACMVALEVARDLRSGAIPPERFCQLSYCGAACCIAGHMAERMNVGVVYWAVVDWALQRRLESTRIHELFHGNQPSDPMLAADAIENYIYNYARHPWTRHD